MLLSELISTNVPLIYGATYLSAYSLQVEADPSAYSTKFVYANQVAIAVSLWCRAIEAFLAKFDPLPLRDAPDTS